MARRIWRRLCGIRRRIIPNMCESKGCIRDGTYPAPGLQADTVRWFCREHIDAYYDFTLEGWK